MGTLTGSRRGQDHEWCFESGPTRHAPDLMLQRRRRLLQTAHRGHIRGMPAAAQLAVLADPP